MRYRKMHAVTLGIDLNAAEPLVCRDRGFGEAVSASETRGLGGERDSDDGFRRDDGGMLRLNEAAGTKEKFGGEKHDDHKKFGIVGEETDMKVKRAESSDAKDVSISEMAINGLEENWETNASRGISNNEITCVTDFISRVSQYGKDEGNGLHLMVDLNGLCSDGENIVGFASNIDSMKETVVQKVRMEARSMPAFGVSDLVWGKVRSHPWWPGQIFDPSAASVKAEKYFKKDSFLIAYFGDQTFAWNEAMSIKPFEEHFTKMEKQSDSRSFCHALDCALEELSRRVEYGLACHCLPKEIYDKISTQTVINAGIKEESVHRNLGDKCSNAAYLEPVRLIEYIKRVAESPLAEGDRLELVVKRSFLLAFSRWRGYNKLPEFKVIDGFLEVGEDNNIASSKGLDRGEMMDGVLAPDSSTDLAEPAAGLNRRGEGGVSGKSKPVSWVELSKKEKSMSDLMAYKQLVSGKKRKVQSPVSDYLATRGRKKFKARDGKSLQVKQIFRVGHKFGKMANEIDGFPTTSCIYRQCEEFLGSFKSMVEQNSPEQMMTQLHSVAQDPGTGYNAFTRFISLFMEFRDFANSNQGADKETVKRLNSSVTGETLDLEYLRDSYWTDRIIQREEQTANEEVISAENLVSNGVISTKSDKEGCNPTALILNFTNLDSIPSEENLNRIFNRFGPLNESETQVFKKTKRAKVVFKRRVDAETAFSSSGKYSIFGPSLVSYSLKYE